MTFITFSSKEYSFFSISLLFLGFILGACTLYFYLDYQETKDETISIQGWRIGSSNKSDALKYAYNSEPYGDWICINTKGMSYERAVQVCQHEAGHEIFAEVCEKDTELCEKTQELLTEYTNGGKR